MTQVRDLLGRLSEHGTTVGPDRILSRAELELRAGTAVDTALGRRWSPTIVVAAAAAVTILLLGGTALVLRSLEEATPTETTAPPIDTPTTAPAPPPPDPISGDWTLHRLSGSYPTAWSVAAGPRGFVIAGVTFTRGDVWGRAGIWTSPDGIGWEKVITPDLFEEGRFATGASVGEEGYLVWGPNDREGGTAVWRSGDGSAWSVEAGDTAPALRNVRATTGLMLPGGDHLLYDNGQAAILLSGPGGAWEAVATPVPFHAITVGEKGLFAVGAGTVWTSADGGRTWSVHGPDDDEDPRLPSAIWALEDTPVGLLAAGPGDAGSAVILRSEDGVGFAPVYSLPSDSAPDTPQIRIDDFAFDGTWTLASGTGPDGPLLLASKDGMAWEAVRLDVTFGEDGLLRGLAERDGVFVAVGEDHSSTGGIGLVLRWDPDSN